MARRKAHRSIRDTVRDTFTPPRVGLLSWAFAALVMGSVGLASYQFGYRHQPLFPDIAGRDAMPGGLPLPPGGDVRSTASIGMSASGRAGRAVEVMRMPHDGEGSDAGPAQGHIEVLQREVIGLRRRLSALSEQNVAYSRRIAALEKQVAIGRLAGAGAGTAERAADTGLEPGPGVVITRTAPPRPLDEASRQAETGASAPDGETSGLTRRTPPAKPNPEAVATLPIATPQGAETKPAPSAAAADAPPAPAQQAQADQAPDGNAPKAPPRLISLYRTTPDTAPAPAPDIDPSEPVRIVAQMPATLPEVTLPDADDAPLTTGSIPAPSAGFVPPETRMGPAAFDATPTQTTLGPKVIAPSSPAGRLRGSESQLKRSDFGAIIGRYATAAEATRAWADFKTQNVERMRDLRPLLMKRNGPEGGVSLMAGPFANAADAAIACLHLLDMTDLCHPALYAGEPLVTAAELRETPF